MAFFQCKTRAAPLLPGNAIIKLFCGVFRDGYRIFLRFSVLFRLFRVFHRNHTNKTERKILPSKNFTVSLHQIRILLNDLNCLRFRNEIEGCSGSPFTNVNDSSDKITLFDSVPKRPERSLCATSQIRHNVGKSSFFSAFFFVILFTDQGRNDSP